MGKGYVKWEEFRVIKKYTLFPLRIYCYTSQSTWWSWLKNEYILQSKKYPSEASSIKDIIYSYFYGRYYKNTRFSYEEEYNDYINYLKNK